MSRLDAYLAWIDDPGAHRLSPGDPADEALLGLLAAVAAIDGEVSDRELDFLGAVLPGRSASDLAQWARGRASAPPDLAALRHHFSDPDERWKVLRFAARMAWKDGRIASAEARLIEALVEALELPEGAFERVIDEVRARVEAPTPSRIAAALHSFQWAAVQRDRASVSGALAAVVPEEANHVARVRLDGVEVLGLCDLGLVGAFLEGPAFVRWTEIVAFTRVPTLGAAVQVHTERGEVWTLVDMRLRGLVTLLDHIYGVQTAPSAPPEVRQVAGGDDL